MVSRVKSKPRDRALLWDDYVDIKKCRVGETITLSDGCEYTKNEDFITLTSFTGGKPHGNYTPYTLDDSTFDRYIKEYEDGDY